VKITNYKIKILRFPLNLRLSKYHVKYSHHLIVKIIIDDKIIGYGEGTPYNTSIFDLYKKSRELLKYFVGKEPNECLKYIEKLYMTNKIPEYFDYGTILGISAALYDAIGKINNVPVCKLLSGSKCFIKKTPIAYIIGIQSNFNKYINLINKALKFGFNIIKIKFTGDLNKDYELLKFIRTNFGFKLKILADVNGNYKSYNKLVKFIKKFEKYDLNILEQPFGAKELRKITKLRKITDIDIMIDESFYTINDLNNIIKLKCCDIINIHPSKFGSINFTRKIIEKIVENDFKYSIGSSIMTNIGVLSYLHTFFSIQADCETYEEIGHYFYSNYTITKEILNIKNNWIKLKLNNGLGVNVEEKWLNRFSINQLLYKIQKKLLIPYEILKNKNISFNLSFNE